MVFTQIGACIFRWLPCQQIVGLSLAIFTLKWIFSSGEDMHIVGKLIGGDDLMSFN